MRNHSSGGVFRITGARAGLTEDVKGRQRRYVISMTVRTLCFLLAISLWHVQTVLAAIALVLGGVLPYIAVVIANAGRENAPSLPSAFVPPPPRPMLERGADPSPKDPEKSEPAAGAEPGEEFRRERTS
ncbi:DUF3099 domain-containing protein [Streptomyces sp. RPT161]|uniref:DUF3099 domain-containing protein n=1 Tax=Streptomyces sp. RPT161 TaxID=3015993 RepID=UPI0022B8E0C3|nr:DUF3099 domain-containing protein [Streptomyces sp. RPT161]